MIKPELTSEIAYKALQRFFYQKPFVLFGTGTSCAVDRSFGMKALEEYLKKEIPAPSLTLKQTYEWDKVVAKLETRNDFESAMNEIKDQKLLNKVIDKTAEHVTNINRKVCFEIFTGKTNWSAIHIFKSLVDGLPETDRALHVATTNYDMLAEYAFANSEIPYITGFYGGVIRKLDWKKSERQVTYSEKIPSGRSKMVSVARIKKHIRFYKVHGSINTFEFNNQIIETDSSDQLVDGFQRIMITPGASKHEALHNYRTALLSEFDQAVRSHSAFLFLGFGFNDNQLLNNAIVDKLRVQNAHGLIITRDTNERIDALLKNSKNTWLVCKNENEESVRIFNCQYKDWLYLHNKEFWKFDEFAEEILGG
ncbi:MAG: SIR2 family protein [Candidatus Riflebacteria bacterium]|nr:SIR2 family protein [Candidatus Riflebacteria bacterium]